MNLLPRIKLLSLVVVMMEDRSTGEKPPGTTSLEILAHGRVLEEVHTHTQRSRRWKESKDRSRGCDLVHGEKKQGAAYRGTVAYGLNWRSLSRLTIPFSFLGLRFLDGTEGHDWLDLRDGRYSLFLHGEVLALAGPRPRCSC